MQHRPIVIYCLPGQGSDCRIFKSLQVPAGFKLHCLPYSTPGKNMSLAAFASEVASQIDTSNKFVLLGHSLGGMLCTEIAELLDPQLTILISSAKNRTELPFRYRFQKVIPLYKIVPGSLLLAGAKFLQPLVEPDRNKDKETFKSMLAGKSAVYMKRSIHLLICWERVSNTKKIIQIHGDNDHTLPIRNIQDPDYIVKDGSHMITLTRPKEISAIINEVLVKELGQMQE